MSTIHPADGLIRRLLKQNAGSANAPDHADAPSTTQRGADHSPEAASHGRERRLESQLLQLYRANRATRDQES